MQCFILTGGHGCDFSFLPNRYTQWHNRLGQVLPSFGTEQVPVLTLYYEDYHTSLNQTATRVLDFLKLEPKILPFREFRDLPDYADHFTLDHRKAAWRLMKALATPWAWERILRYRNEEDF